MYPVRDPDIGVPVQVEVAAIREHNLRVACGLNLHVAVGRTRFDHLNVIVDQEDVLHLYEVGLGSPEDGIDPAEADDYIFHAREVFSVHIPGVATLACIDQSIVQLPAILRKRQPYLVTLKIDLPGSECESFAKIPCISGCHSLLIAA